MASKVGRKYGRKNRLATVDLGTYCPTSSSGNLHRSPTPTSATPHHVQAEVETQNDQRVSALTAHPRIQPRRIARRALLHPRRKKPFAKSLAQRLFEAEVFSSGTTPSHPAADASVRNPAHTSTRRPLQFVTSLNLVPPLENRIFSRRKGVREGARRDHDGSGAPAAQADPEELVLGASTTSAQGASPNRLAAAAVATPDHYPSSRNRNKATTQRARTGGSAAVLAPGRRVAQTRARGGKLSTARLRPTKPFEYVPLPLVWVKKTRQLEGPACAAAHARARTHVSKTNFNFN